MEKDSAPLVAFAAAAADHRFLLLALGMTAVFLGGMQRALSTGWRDAARPLLADYMDRLVADIGTLLSVERAQALTARLSIAIRIEGPQMNWYSHPARLDQSDTKARISDWLSRSTADGHRVSFGWARCPAKGAPHIWA